MNQINGGKPSNDSNESQKRRLLLLSHYFAETHITRLNTSVPNLIAGNKQKKNKFAGSNGMNERLSSHSHRVRAALRGQVRWTWRSVSHLLISQRTQTQPGQVTQATHSLRLRPAVEAEHVRMWSRGWGDHGHRLDSAQSAVLTGQPQSVTAPVHLDTLRSGLAPPPPGEHHSPGRKHAGIGILLSFTSSSGS